MKVVLVCGGRGFENSRLLYRTLDKIRAEHGIDRIITGGATGADRLAERYAENAGILCRVYPAAWEIHGRMAGPIRNTQMLEIEKPDMVVAFPGGRGTADMVRKATEAGVPVHEAH